MAQLISDRRDIDFVLYEQLQSVFGPLGRHHAIDRTRSWFRCGRSDHRGKKNADGTYSISGNKTFITCGDQNLTENIIHPVLARIEGAPQGTKGISLFLVPKFWVNDDGNYIVDFYCPAAKLIVEVDGGQHYISADNQKDKVRDQYLDNLGFKVLRFSNRDIFKNIDGVLQKIYDYL